MSGNTQAIPISLDNFVDDKDVSGKICRADFETLAKPLFDRIRNTLINLLKEARK
jgi:molecular chaperone DnaK (HSP70)